MKNQISIAGTTIVTLLLVPVTAWWMPFNLEYWLRYGIMIPRPVR